MQNEKNKRYEILTRKREKPPIGNIDGNLQLENIHRS